MKYAIFLDIHGNFPDLKAALAAVKTWDAENFLVYKISIIYNGKNIKKGQPPQ